MPWCETCDRFYNPNTLNADGTCPTCGRHVSEPTAVAEADEVATPWHFKVLLVAVVGYLGWRLIEGIIWVAEKL
ncbi:MAG TPA: hypothetical protein VIR58_14830 [Acidimicrobiales bacterium]